MDQKEASASTSAPAVEFAITASGLTIVRLKRKRNEEPLDALVVQQLENEKKKVRRKASALRIEGVKENQRIDVNTKEELEESLPFIFRFAETVDEISFNDSTKTQQLKDRIVKLMNRKDTLKRKGIDTKQFREQQIARSNENRRKERYKVIDRNRQKSRSNIISSDDIENEDETVTDLFKMYDAVKENEMPIKPKFVKDDVDSEIMCNFIPMVRQYLSLQEQVDKENKADPDDGYVYDVYYRDDAMDLDDQINYNNIAALTWLDDDENELFVNESDEKDEFFYSDEEDSNAEDYYTHDYPDEDEDETWSIQGFKNLITSTKIAYVFY